MKDTKFIKRLNSNIKENINLKNKIKYKYRELKLIVEIIYNTIKSGNKVFICGNGGSAADAQHLAAEFLVRLKSSTNRRPYPLLSLALDTSTITACANDLGFENLFARNLRALANDKDSLIVISTSGNSKNIIKVLDTAKKMKIISIGLLGNKGGKARKIVNYPLIVPSKNVARIQEAHIFLGHFILSEVEKKLIREKN